MTEITPLVRVGINAKGEANVEVWDLPRDHPDAEMVEVFIPANALEELAKFLLKSA
jgi:hypothetical protein